MIPHLVGLASLLGGVLVHVNETIAGKGRIITVLVFVFRKKKPVDLWVIWAIGVLTLTNIAIAVLWH